MREKLALDAKESVRKFDDNGNMHVAFSHLTKAQVRPYYGNEIPGWEQLRLDPLKVYKGYCPAEELARPETIESTNAIPIQLNHHSDYADAPALETRIGSTGTDGAYRHPYLDNSLHFTVQKAIDRIKDGSMRELSLSYRYTPDFTPGETPEGEAYDFVMRDISANHVAIVEEGRAGRDVLVEDHSLEVKAMDVNEKTAVDTDPAVEAKEVALANTIKSAAEGIEDLHETDEQGGIVDTPATDDEDKDAAIKGIIDALIAKGLSPEDAQSFVEPLRTLAGSAAGATDEDPAGGETGTEECAADEDDLIQDALKECGMDEESPEVQKAFIEGVRYAQKNAGGEAEAAGNDEDPEAASDSEEEKPAMGADAAMKRMERRIMDRFAAMDECKPSLGKIRVNAFDSAEAIYLAALKQEGVNVSGMSKRSARDAYRSFMAGRKKAAKATGLANDSAKKIVKTALSEKIAKIRKGA